MTQQTPADTQREVTDRDLRESLFQMQRRHPANHMEIGFAMRLARDLIREREASAQVHGMWKLAVEMVEQRDREIARLREAMTSISGVIPPSSFTNRWVSCVQEIVASALAQPGASGEPAER